MHNNQYTITNTPQVGGREGGREEGKKRRGGEERDGLGKM